jgi:hypothetical protein
MKARQTALALVLGLLAFPVTAFAQTSRSGPIVGHSEGNHRLDCTIIRPWAGDGGPGDLSSGPFPAIGWANGWGQGNVFGANQIEAYISGLTLWAEEGDYLVVAANQWSARASDILQCLQWLVDQNSDPESDYYMTVDTASVGIAGQSQGGGAALSAGDGVLMDGDGFAQIRTVVAMNPYGPSWVESQIQPGQILLLGGTNDSATPTDSFSPVLEGVILSGDHGGVQAELVGGTHCNPACRPDFGVFGEVSLLWWEIFLRDDLTQCPALIDLLEDGSRDWNTDYSDNFICPVL